MKGAPLILLLFLMVCSAIDERTFQFKYEVTLEPSYGKKVELWIPYPQSNEVQDISGVTIDTDMDYLIKQEQRHGNKYLYLHNEHGLESSTDISMTFNEFSMTFDKIVNDF